MNDSLTTVKLIRKGREEFLKSSLELRVTSFLRCLLWNITKGNILLYSTREMNLKTFRVLDLI